MLTGSDGDQPGGVISKAVTTAGFFKRLQEQQVRLWLEDEQLKYSAPRGAMTAALLAQLRERKADLIAFIRGAHASAEATPVARATQDAAALALSFGQEHLWLVDQLEPGNVAYNMACVVRLAGPLDMAALDRGLEEIVRHHPVLRARFSAVEGNPVQTIGDDRHASLETIYLDGVVEQSARLQQQVQELVRQPFDLGAGPLLRAAVLRLSADDHALVLVTHHIAADAWSGSLLLREVGLLYGAFRLGQPSPLPAPSMQFADFARWERTHLQGEVLERKLTYWEQRLQGMADLALPTDRPRPAVQRHRGAILPFQLPAPLAGRLEAMGKAQGATLFMTLLAAFQVLLHRYSGQTDIGIGASFAGRNRPEFEAIPGHFANVAVLRNDLAGNPSFIELLECVRRSTLEAFEHSDTPFGLVVERVNPPRDASRNPLFQVLFVLHNRPAQALEFDGLSCTPLEVDPGTAQFDLTLSLVESTDGLTGKFEYNTDLFDAATIARMAGHFDVLVTAIAADPAQGIGALPLLTPQEKRTATADWNATERARPDLCLHQLIEAQVERTPQAVAVVFEEQSLTYSELNANANRLAHHLRGLGVGPDVLVGLCAERSIEMAVGLLAILKAGGAYVPLDPSYPRERLSYMLSDAAQSDAGRPMVLLTQAALGDRLPAAPVTVMNLDADASLWAGQPADNLHSEVAPDDLTYMIYTSGSTGKPKGALNTHRGIVNRLLWMQEEYRLDATDRVLQKTPFSFDVSVWEFFWPLMTGAQLVMAKPEGHKDSRYLVDLIAEQNITTLHFVPSMLNVFLETADAQQCGSVKRVFCSGEALAYETQERFFASMDAELHNLYGPTEAAVDVTYWACRQNTERGLIPIGRPIANTQIHLLDAYGNPVPIGVPGELHIGGVGLARGYHNRPELTAEKFIHHPALDARLYKSGDLARRLPDGAIEYLGRLDHQVKIRGFRIELGEIEAAIAQCPDVRDSVVVAREDSVRGKELVAYLAAAAPDEDALAQQLRACLKQQLPDYMVPSTFVVLDALPLSPNGKVDRKALPAPQRDAGGGHVAPRTATEERLAAIWTQALGLARVGVHDNFFELGGHSLSAMQVVGRVHEAFQVELPLRTLFDAPTLAGLAERIESMRGDAAAESLPVLVPDPDTRHEPFPLTDVQRAYWLGRGGLFEFGNSAAHLYQEVECADLDLDRFTQALRRLIERHDALRLVVREDGRQQILRDVPPYDIQLLDVRGQAPHEAEAALLALREHLSHQIFDVHQWPLFEVRASLMDEGKIRLHIGLDLLIFDGSSLLILGQELGELYADPAAELPALAVSFRDYVLADQALHESARYRTSLEYWRAHLADFPGAPDLPLALQPGELAQPRFTRHTGGLPAAQWAQIKQWGAKRGLAPTHVILTAFSELLATWSKTPRFALNLTLYHRMPLHPQVDQLVGDFTALEMLALDASADASFEQSARRVQRQLWSDLDHRYVTGVQVLQELNRMQGGRTMMPIVVTSLLHHSDAVNAVTLPWQAALGFGVSQTPQMWLDHQVIEVQGALVFNWDVLDGLFPDGLVQDMLAAYHLLLQRLAQDEAAWSEAGRCLVPAAQLALRQAVNATEAPLSNELLHTLVEAQAALRANEAAVIAPSRTLTYAEVTSRARRVGRWLRERGAQPNQLVAVVMEKGWEQVVAVLGVLQSGAAYLPIDPALPQERQHYLLEQAQVKFVLTHASLSLRLSLPAGLTVACVDDEPSWQAVSDAPLAAVQKPMDLAYVIYTSGSTGLPKGVMIDHRGAVNTVLDINDRFGVGPQDRVLALSALNFDLSVYDIFGLLAAGGAIVVPAADASRDPDRWLAQMTEAGVTIWNTVPALLELLAGQGERHPAKLRDALGKLRIAQLSGDWIPVSLPERVWKFAPHLKLHSLGGATEASIWSIGYPIERVDPAWTSIPYGKPLRNQTFHVLKPDLHPCPVWTPGELYIGGVGVAQGYWRDEEKTRNSFVTHPRTGERLYKTGDMGCWLLDGNIEFLGREDNQVKISGYRIELGEIESALAQHPDVKAGVVSVIGEQQNRRLVAHVVRTGRESASDVQGAAATTAGVPQREGLRTGEHFTPHPLPQPALDPALLEVYDRRRTHRAFLNEEIELEHLSAFLACLGSRPSTPTPSHHYTSAGSLYAVQVYLVVKPGRVTGLPGGSYYYDPVQHHLLALKPGVELDASLHYDFNRPAFKQSAFSIFLIGKMSAVTPKYGERSSNFCLLEAGAMTQLMLLTAPAHGLGLCEMGDIWGIDKVQDVLLLDKSHELLHVMVAGMPDPSRQAAVASKSVTTTAAPVQAEAKTDAALIEEVRGFLEAKLPSYMVPQQIVVTEALPLSANGKVDRTVLAQQFARMAPVRKEGVAPGSELERILAQTVREELALEEIQLETVGIDDNFFDIGFSSTTVIRLHGRIQQALDREFSVIKLFEHANVRALAAWLIDASGDTEAVAQEYARGRKKQDAMARRRQLRS